MKYFFPQQTTNQSKTLLDLIWYGLFSMQPPAGLDRLSGTDWEQMTCSILEQDLGGILCKAIQRCGIKDEVPPSTLDMLKQAYFHNVFQYLESIGILPEIFQAAQGESIRILLLRGIHLTEVFYKDPGLRSCVDADLLIEKEDRTRITDVLGKLGFYPHQIYKNLYFRDNYCLDIHTHPLNERRKGVRNLVYPLNFDDIWKEHTEFILDRTSIYAPSAYDELIFSALHAIKHAFSHLKWLLDLAVIIDWMQTRLHWGSLAQRATASNLQHGVWLALELTGSLFPKAIPAELRSLFQSKGCSTCNHPALQRDLANFQPDLYFLRHIKGFGRKMRWAIAAVFPEKAVREEIVFAEDFKGLAHYYLSRCKAAWTVIKSL